MLEPGNDNVRKRRISVKDYSLKQLAILYNVSRYIFRRKLAPHQAAIGKRNGQFYDPYQVELIFRLIPLPSHIEVVKV
jgi:hypothetical protein